MDNLDRGGNAVYPAPAAQAVEMCRVPETYLRGKHRQPLIPFSEKICPITPGIARFPFPCFKATTHRLHNFCNEHHAFPV
jgi:hypothetical protein